ncbi:MAG TPA: hypothetical protein VD932_01145, partial [Aquabacterium sp.]|nr:hypothetical protein [Aquabacterium sp.]
MSAGATRRALLRAAPAALLAPAAAAASNALRSNPDAALLTACDRLIWLNAEHDRLCEPFYEVVGPMPDEVQHQVAAVVDENAQVRERIIDTPARTGAGLQAKARAILAEMGEPCQYDDD